MSFSSIDELINLIFQTPRGLETNFGTCPVFTGPLGDVLLLPNVGIAETFRGRWGRLVASGTGPAEGAWWPGGLFCRRQEADPAHTSFAGGRAGSTHKGFFGQLFSLEGSGKALPLS